MNLNDFFKLCETPAPGFTKLTVGHVMYIFAACYEAEIAGKPVPDAASRVFRGLRGRYCALGDKAKILRLYAAWRKVAHKKWLLA